MSADIVIRGGTVVDGTGAPGRRADVAIRGDRISEIGSNLSGARTLDASGQIVAPGFIDLHTHYDAQVFWDPALTPSCFHGVTSVIAGNCGFSLAPTRPEHRETIARTLQNVEDMNVESLTAGIPWDFESFPDYLASVGRRGTLLNYGAYLGHTALRLFVMGDAAYERAATPDEIERMCAVLGDGMRAGAAGFATSFAPTHQGVGGKPIPSRFAERAEFEALAAVVGRAGRGIVHVAPGQNVSIPNLYEIQAKVGRPFTYGALLTMPTGSHKNLVELNDRATAQGGNVWPQVSPRPLSFVFTMEDPFTLNVGGLFKELMSKSRAERLRCYADAEWRRNAVKDLDQAMMKPRWDTYKIEETRKFPELQGRRLEDLAAERRASPLDVACELALAEDLSTRFRGFIANDDPEGVAWLLTRDHVVLGLSDAGAHVGQLCDACAPTDLLGNWVRERGALPVERAVRKLSGEIADLLGLAGRGYLCEAAFADVAVFDPARVAPGPIRRVRDFPANAERLTADRPEGMTHVLVNGTPIRENGESTQALLAGRPGRLAAPN
jgi:N-acyl-D-aspartate/D-glutamate deacylase